MSIRKPVKTKLDEVIDHAVSELASYNADSEEYAKIVDRLTELYALKSNEKTDRISKDTLIMVAGNLLGIVVIVGHERAHVVTSKALNLIGKFK